MAPSQKNFRDFNRGRDRNKTDPSPNGDGLWTTCLSTVQPEPIRWLVPGYILLGKLVLLVGDGGQGKSTLTLGLTAAVTTGGPAFGLGYQNATSGEVLLICCEDDRGDTIVPRLIVAGAKRERIHAVDGCKVGEKTATFTLAHYRSLEAELEQRPDVRLVVIDPAGAYVGGARCDDNNDTELRTLPLRP
jgi:putative DNA primase/helicase